MTSNAGAKKGETFFRRNTMQDFTVS
jgi:hypothetical protein